MIDINPYIGVPYKPGGRGPDGWDCYGLVKYLFGLRGIQLPDWDVDPADVRAVARQMRDGVRVEMELGYAQEIKEPVDWAIVMVGRARACNHIGVCLAGGVIHANQRLSTVWNTWPQFVRLFGQSEVRLYQWRG